MKKVCIAILSIVFLVSTGFAADMAKQTFSATLTGNDGVPPVTTDAKGEATFMLSKDGKKLIYNITATNLAGVRASHIHMGKKGENGDPIALIKVKATKGKMTGTLAKGTITKKELMTSLKGKDLQALVDVINAGNAYVNVHTTKFPDGEIRGQIVK
jgi:hypothetical protein